MATGEDGKRERKVEDEGGGAGQGREVCVHLRSDSGGGGGVVVHPVSLLGSGSNGGRKGEKGEKGKREDQPKV